MKKILVLGANGFSGQAILQTLLNNDACQPIGSSLHACIAPSDRYAFFPCDLRNRDALSTLFRQVEPEVVINTSALSVPDYCETHHSEAYETNVTAVKNIARLCEQYEARLIHLSTDFVFDGLKATLYTEEDLPLPINYYGLTKLQGEQTVASHCSDWAIARVAVVYGNALPGQHGNIVQLVHKRLSEKQPIKVVTDQYRTPTWVGDVAQGVSQLIEHPLNGIYHICGKECNSIADWAYRTADFFHLDRSLILPVTTEEMQEKTPRPKQSGMSIEKACNELHYHPLSFEEALSRLR